MARRLNKLLYGENYIGMGYDATRGLKIADLQISKSPMGPTKKSGEAL